MSMFSEYLRQLIQSRDISISRLSRDSGVERTAIHKALAGGRILPYRAVELLMYYLKLSPGESQRLYQYYNQLFEREEVSKAWKVIDKIILNLSELSGFMPVLEEEPYYSKMSLAFFQPGKSTYKGIADISGILRWIIEKEMEYSESKMELVTPSHAQVMKKCIESLYKSHSAMAISHIVCFDSSEVENEYNLQNLECLRHVLPGCIMSGRQYDIFYYYNNVTQIQYTDPLPYFMVTHSGVLCFSENFQTAIFLEEKEQIDYFHACFCHLKQTCHRLIEYLDEPVIFPEYITTLDEGKGCSFIVSQPYTMEIWTKKMLVLFTRKGIREFLNTEKHYDFFTGSTIEIGERKRLEMLRTFFEKIQNNQMKGKMVDDIRFAIPENFCIFISVDFGILICDKDGAWGVQIRESSLCRAFYDWSRHFAEGDYVLTKERMAEIFAEAL